MNWYKQAQESELEGLEDSKGSQKFTWHYDVYEMFEFVMSSFDVGKAKEIIHNKPRPVHNMSLEGLKTLIPKRPVPVKGGGFTMHPGIGVNWAEIDKEDIDLTFPVIVVTRKDGSYLPIDGWHRMAKAMDKGIMSLPAVLLDAKESKEVTIS